MKEEVTPITVHWPQLEQHVLEVAIELCGSSVSGIDATLAALKLQVLQRLFDTLAHATLGFTNVELQHVGTGPMQPIETATSQLAQRTLTVSARFSAYAQSPETFV